MPTNLAVKVSHDHPELWVGEVINLFLCDKNLELKCIYVDEIDVDNQSGWLEKLYNLLDANNIKRFGGNINLQEMCEKNDILLLRVSNLDEVSIVDVEYLIDLNPNYTIPPQLLSKINSGVIYFSDDSGIVGDIGYKQTLSGNPVVKAYVNLMKIDELETAHRYQLTLKANNISLVRVTYEVMLDVAQYATYIIKNKNLQKKYEVSKTDKFLVEMSGLVFFKFLLYSFYLRVRDQILYRLFNQQWRIRYGKYSEPLNIRELHEVVPPKDVFWADPFIVQKNDKTYIFCEELIYKTNIGHLSVLTLDKNNNIISNDKLLKESYHLSYPFVFLHEDTYYMIPETGGNRTIDLYECVKFPEQWTKKTTLMEDVEAYDVTVIKYNDVWWMFASHSTQSGNPNVYLYLYFSNDLISGEWTSHPLNPIVTDVTVARCGGNLYIESGNLIRPSQDCSVTYGWATNKNLITKLTKDEYEEKLLVKYMPNWDRSALAQHTLSTDGDVVVIDALYHRKK